ncbi:unnamed protein product [Tuber melanosporum]|uniref:(Perigord truffle) hypothetical protein n=1 Tax=Tuber melanosporum (strain Mel28) TaxID=656061 RepID=D5GDD9_TUBMM|nr:uncharacterized protein GSTUM_00006166001 [Tuber melanosporum]CAZ82532.1 unnamed protein product [Tuber melanosporum]
MSKELSYPKTPANKVNRYSNRAHYDTTTIHNIINTTPVLHVSFLTPSDASDASSPPHPTILPMLGQMGSFTHPSSDESDALDCYLHGYTSSRLQNLTRSSSSSNSGGMPICVAATKLDGLVLSLTPNSHSCNYRSAILHGTATMVEDVEEKIYAMRLITEGMLPGRWQGTRVPPDETELRSTGVLKVVVSSASAKVRSGGPSDESKDVERAEVTGRVWTGVVPVWEMMGCPVPAGEGVGGQAPGYVAEYVEGRNGREKGYAEGAAAGRVDGGS